MLKIWGRVNSINVMKVLWCADEIGLEYERVDAGMKFGVVQDDDYRAMNPNSKIPTIDDNGVVLWESNVIVRYLSAKYSSGTLWPVDAGERAKAEQWMDWQQTTPYADITYLFWGKVRNSPAHQEAARIHSATENLQRLWGLVDAALEEHPYLGGDTLTMGDIPLGTAVWRYYNMDIDRVALPNLEAWHDRLKERPAFQKNVMLPLT